LLAKILILFGFSKYILRFFLLFYLYKTSTKPLQTLYHISANCIGFHCCPVKIPAVFLLPLKLWVFQQILIVCGLGSAPTGQEALSPGQRPGLKTGGRFALTGQKLNRMNAFAL
jgi:hypothetical protein